MLKIEGATLENFKDIPSPCRYCLYWQTKGEYSQEMLKSEREKEKREWFKKVTSTSGPCIKTAYLNGKPIGFMQYAPAKFFPQVKEYTSEQPSTEAVFIACLFIIDKDDRGKGFGRAMLKGLLDDLKQRGFKVVETYARRSSAENPSGPLKLYLKHDFRARNEENDFPLVHLELR